jgi:hypothetical protein
VSFNIGDKVTRVGEDVHGWIRFGPVDTAAGPEAYLVEMEGSKHRLVRAQFLAPFAETFKAGDHAVGAGTGQPYTILAGPFKDCGEYYVVQRGDGREVPIHAENLLAV